MTSSTSAGSSISGTARVLLIGALGVSVRGVARDDEAVRAGDVRGTPLFANLAVCPNLSVPRNSRGRCAIEHIRPTSCLPAPLAVFKFDSIEGLNYIFRNPNSPEVRNASNRS